MFSKWFGRDENAGIEWRSGREAPGDIGGVGTLGLENRLLVPTLRPASCSMRMRSAMVPPNFTGLSSVLGPSALPKDVIIRSNCDSNRYVLWRRLLHLS
jgi:hypothetical protein